MQKKYWDHATQGQNFIFLKKKVCGHIFIKTVNKEPSGINFEDYFLEK